MTRPLVFKELAAPQPKAAAAVAGVAGLAGVAMALSDRDILLHAWPLAAGFAFGVALQRGELSLVRAWRDLLMLRNSGQLLGFTAALGVAAALTLGGLGLSGATVAPHGARIAPVSWLLPIAAFAFGFGSVLARGSLMVHLRRLGEGSLVAVPALLATFVGVLAALVMWPFAYAHALGAATPYWLPDVVGPAPALALQLALLCICTILLWRWRPHSPEPAASLFERATVHPWPPAVAGALVGLIAAACYGAGEPLGLTGECAAVARYVGTWAGLVPTALPGLDTGISGLVVPLRGPGFTGHAVIVAGVIVGAFAAALASGRFAIAGMSARDAARMAAGGLLIGWGAMLGLGSVTGAAISGVAIGAVSGWVFLTFASLGIVAGLRAFGDPSASG